MHRTGIEDYYIIKDNQKLRFGYTTGSCAAAAAKAAASMLLTGNTVTEVQIGTPKGITLNLEVHDIRRTSEYVSCGIIKDGGDDPDATNGLLICAKVTKTQDGITIDGGIGVGRVTRPGLQQEISEAAINPVPRQMIMENLRFVCDQTGYEGGLHAEIFVPEGAETAKHTFNPRLGIEGGISILGTRGIVEPMSERALIASIRLEMEMHRKRGAEYLLITPGSYGENFASKVLHLKMDASMQSSNYIGETLDLAVNLGFSGVLFVSHIGKFIKVAGGIMNTHSRDADCRAELMAAFGLRAGCDAAAACRLLESNTTDEALDILEEAGIREKAMQIAVERIHYYMQHRAAGALKTEAVIYGGRFGILGQTKDAETLLHKFRDAN